ncbi:hypothetical protein B7H23_04580 [Notoacmeibacter marinus]|uniref:DUF2938 domain-containing protein n=1 Tax=Notoacmeibacter marinus TaxID=1876515 RepID=A0A231V228_9HYPH|nr:DUF2938 domain-containing protein [Notoacmeibacter marinus]OXT02200.1 hypothetical protein B7H23_04580 [Notoacmeibacter marinus]
MAIWSEWALSAIAIGVIATVVMDVWAIFLKFAFSIPSLNYAFVGRWFGHLAAGRFSHPSIAKAAPVAGEGAIGWVAHYMISIAFAAGLLLVVGPEWVEAPTVWPALLTGWITLLAPFFILQPGFGFGIAASKTPRPNVARWRSFMAHTVFGLGLFVGAWVVAAAPL